MTTYEQTSDGDYVSSITNLCDGCAHSVAIQTHHAVKFRMQTTQWTPPEILADLAAFLAEQQEHCQREHGRTTYVSPA